MKICVGADCGEEIALRYGQEPKDVALALYLVIFAIEDRCITLYSRRHYDLRADVCFAVDIKNKSVIPGVFLQTQNDYGSRIDGRSGARITAIKQKYEKIWK